MNNQIAPDIDPLGTYNLSNFPTLENFASGLMQYGNTYPYSVKLENYHNPNYYNLPQAIPNKCTENIVNDSSINMNYNLGYMGNGQIDTNPEQYNETQNNNADQNNVEEQDIKPDITTLNLTPRTRRKIKKERSKYFSEKITEKDFKFYGCAVCNVNFKELHELDNHVVVHKDRITSYDLRIKNQIKKKMLKKEMKKNKKLKKKKGVKVENDIEIEIKPEDGFIGNEKASDFLNSTESDNQSSKENNEVTSENKESNEGNSSQALTKQDSLNSPKKSNSTETVNQSSKKSNESKEKGDNKEAKEGSSNQGQTIQSLITKHDTLNLQKIYKCFACQKQFTLSYYLKLHVRSHTDEKPYTCAQCGQSFITASKLGRHNKRFHLAIRYQCRICYKYFSRFEFLTRHFDKKHPDDKLEGEPYDFNAILPYLKELEEQLREKSEKEKVESKPEDPWKDSWGVEAKTEPREADVKEEKEKIEPVTVVEPLTVTIEEIKVDLELETQVKVEALEEKPGGADDDTRHDDDDDDGCDDDVKDENDHVKDEDASDDDYFPSNTWASSPKPEAPPSPKKLRLDERLSCPVCKKRFSTASYMRIHMRTHTGEKPFKCYLCSMSFITSSKMHRHVLTHPESWADDDVKEEKDEKEGVDIKTEDGKTADEDQKAKKKLRMKKALAKFAKKPRQTEKTKRLYQKRQHACEYCQKRFLHLETLQVHRKSHEGESLVYKCNFCLAEHPDAAARKAHEASHAGPKPYLCTICGRSYKKRETMIYHRKNHRPDREYICDICTKSFNAQCKLQRHIVNHRTQRFVLRYECPVCAHMFHTKYHVQMHLSTHQKEGLIQEENRNEILAMVLQNARKIPKTADAPASLTDIVPADERSRVCNICGEVFQHFYYLEEHLKSHGSKIAIEDSEKVEEKKHVCTVCNKGFKLHYYLKLHSFTHTKEKPFICQQCGKGFITRGKLKRHIETHTGLKKYQCHICYKFFTRPSYLRIHVRTIHGTQDYNFRMEKAWNQFEDVYP